MARDIPSKDIRRLPARTQLADDVAAYVRDLIVSGQVPAGQYLRLENLAEQLGTSVTPVREALVSLRGEGFVVLQPRRGFVVAPFTREDIDDVYQVQAFLAGELAARACTRADQDTRDSLERVQVELEAAHARGEAAEVERLNHDFHRTINLTAQAPKLVRFLSTATRYSPRLYFSEIAGWPQASAEDHRAVLAAFHDGSAENARAAMSRHVGKAGVLLGDYLDRRGQWQARRTEDHG